MDKIELTKIKFKVCADIVQKEMEAKAKDGMFKEMFIESVECYKRNLERILFDE